MMHYASIDIISLDGSLIFRLPAFFLPLKNGLQTNNNVHSLLHFATENELFLTMTKFQHKMSHCTTWTAPYKPLTMPDRETCRNPFRNQSDYVLINVRYIQFVTNFRS